ncbi:MAG TPA: kelch repeat-containing protein, partial [Phototrophicaceae bacterium]|nr:kelch repeat-containing protein [Phototrophicaceae bacterium]
MRLFHRFKAVIPLLILIFAGLALNPPSTVQAASNCDLYLAPWTTMSTKLPYMHLKGPSAFVNGKFYLMGGFRNSALQVSSRVDVYNAVSGQWDTTADTPLPMSHSAAVVDGKYIWLIGGFIGDNPGTATTGVWKYDTDNNSWSTAPSLPQPRAAGAAVIVGRDLHYYGGASLQRDSDYPEHWVLNLDNTGAGWKTAPDFPMARIHQGSVEINGIIYAVGGQHKHDHDPIDLPYVHTFNPANGQWTRKADMPMPRSHFESDVFALNGRILVVGGRANQSGAGNGQLSQATEYNPNTNTWRELNPMPGKLISPNGFFYNNKLIVTAGGSNWNTGNYKMYTTTVSYTNCDSTATPTATATNTKTSVPPTSTPTSTPVPPTATKTATNTKT